VFARVFLAVVVLAAAGCPDPKPRDPTRPRGGSAQPDAGVAVVVVPENRQDCDALVAHAIGLYLAELDEKLPAAQMPGEDEIAKLRAELLADPACSRFSTEAYQCALAAKTLRELEACGRA
jgi:hypothetical protein